MKTLNEKTEAIENLMDKIEKLTQRLSGQRAILHTYLPISYMPPNIEIQVRYDPSILLLDFCFLEEAVIYHIENYAILVRKLFKQMKLMFNDLQMDDGVFQTTMDTRTANKISYEFDSFVVKFLQAMDKDTINDLEVVAKGSRHCDKFNSIKEKRSRKIADGLFWQLNLLRNPAAHYMKPNFQEKNGVPIRFASRSSRAETLHSVSRINCPRTFGSTDFRRELHKRNNLVPPASPGFRYCRVFFIPFFSKIIQSSFGSICRRSQVNFFKVYGNRFSVFVGDIFH